MYSREMLRDIGRKNADARAIAAACKQTLCETLSSNDRKCFQECNATRFDAEGSWRHDEGKSEVGATPASSTLGTRFDGLAFSTTSLRNSI